MACDLTGKCLGLFIQPFPFNPDVGTSREGARENPGLHAHVDSCLFLVRPPSLSVSLSHPSPPCRIYFVDCRLSAWLFSSLWPSAPVPGLPLAYLCEQWWSELLSGNQTGSVEQDVFVTHKLLQRHERSTHRRPSWQHQTPKKEPILMLASGPGSRLLSEHLPSVKNENNNRKKPLSQAEKHRHPSLSLRQHPGLLSPVLGTWT